MFKLKGTLQSWKIDFKSETPLLLWRSDDKTKLKVYFLQRNLETRMALETGGEGWQEFPSAGISSGCAGSERANHSLNPSPINETHKAIQIPLI